MKFIATLVFTLSDAADIPRRSSRERTPEMAWRQAVHRKADRGIDARAHAADFGAKMNNRAVGVRVAHPLFQAEGSGAIPTTALCLRFNAIDLKLAKKLNRLWHSRLPSFGGGGSRACHVAEFDGLYYATAIWTNPSAAKLPQRTWLMLKRWAIADDAPKNTASRMMMWMVKDVRKRLPEVEVLVSYSDPDTHDGAIYKACGWEEGETTKRTLGSKQWYNRARGKRSDNEACERVTRWTKRLRGKNW